MIDYIRRHEDRFGVEPICPVLSEHGIQVTGSTYTAQAARGFEPAFAAEIRLVGVSRREGDQFARREAAQQSGAHGEQQVKALLRPDLPGRSLPARGSTRAHTIVVMP